MGTLNTETHLLDAGLDVNRNVFGRYGYDHDIVHYALDDVRMKYSAAALALGARNVQPGPWGIDYHPQLHLGAFDATQGHETTADIYLPASKHLDTSLSLLFAINARLAWTTISDGTESNNVLLFAPAFDFHQGQFSAHFGLYPTIATNAPVQI